MRLPRNRNDRVLLSTVAATALLGAALWINPFGPAAANPDPVPHVGHAPLAHALAKTVAMDGPVSIVRDPTELPAPIGKRGPMRVKVDLDTVEVTGTLADGATYRYWTFNQKVPGPFIRVRVGDTVEVSLEAGRATPGGTLIDFPISRQDVAEMTGTTLHTVSRVLSAWEAAGFVEGGRQRIMIRDLSRLKELAEAPRD